MGNQRHQHGEYRHPDYNIYYTPSPANDVTGLAYGSEYRGTAEMRPNITGPVPILTRDQSIAAYFGPAIGAAGSVFPTPSANNPFGNLGRDAFRAPGLAQLDLGITKNFSVTERMKVQFRSEFFNILNHTNFGLPNQQANSTAFGSITSTNTPRQIQFGLKLLF